MLKPLLVGCINLLWLEDISKELRGVLSCCFSLIPPTAVLRKCLIRRCTVKTPYCNIPDTHFAKWSHYLAALALIGHLISLALSTQWCRCQVN